MIHDTTNRSNDTTGSEKEKKTCFNAYFQYSQPKIKRLNKAWWLKNLAMLKSESKTSETSENQALF